MHIFNKVSIKCLSVNSFSYLEIWDSQIWDLFHYKSPEFESLQFQVPNLGPLLQALPMEHIWTMLMHKILQNHLLCAFVANLKIGGIYALYPESFCDKNLAIRKVFAFCDSGWGTPQPFTESPERKSEKNIYKKGQKIPHCTEKSARKAPLIQIQRSG